MKFRKNSWLLLLLIIFLALIWLWKTQKSDGDRIQNLPSAEQPTEPEISIKKKDSSAQLPQKLKNERKPISNKECLDLYADYFYEIQQKDFVCVTHKTWGLYEIEGRDEKYVWGPFEVRLQLNKEDLLPVGEYKQYLDLAVSVAEAPYEKPLKEIAKFDLRLNFKTPKEFGKFQVHALYEPIKERVIKVLDTDQFPAGFNVRQLADAYWEDCRHKRDPKQWLKVENQWTYDLREGVFRSPEGGYIQFKGRSGAEGWAECAYL